MKNVVVCVSGGIAAYKVVDLVTELKKKKLNTFVVMTEHATRIVSPLALEKASGNKVRSELFEKDFDYKKVLTSRRVDHIDLSDVADLVLIAPATANVIAKLAHGLADDLLTTTLLATRAPIFLCPSMNVHMWANEVVQENIQKLLTRGYRVIPPEKGMQACGYEGVGRLPGVNTILSVIQPLLDKQTSLLGKKILVTVGATTDEIDDVRFLTNRSSGKMGVAIAQECFLLGADVLLLRSKTAMSPVYVIQEKTFTTADDLENLLQKHLPKTDVVFHVAAVSDFAIKKAKGKIKSTHPVSLALSPRKKIISQIKKLNPKVTLIAFKAEAESDEEKLIEIGKKKLKEWDADAVVLNDISKKDRGFQAETNEVIVVQKNGIKKISLAPKREVAKAIIKFLFEKKTADQAVA